MLPQFDFDSLSSHTANTALTFFFYTHMYIYLDSACGDGGGRVRIWRFPEDTTCTVSSELKGDISTPPEPIPPLVIHKGDTYSVKFCHPDPSRLITAGHDRSRRVGIGKLVKLLSQPK